MSDEKKGWDLRKRCLLAPPPTTRTHRTRTSFMSCSLRLFRRFSHPIGSLDMAAAACERFTVTTLWSARVAVRRGSLG